MGHKGAHTYLFIVLSDEGQRPDDQLGDVAVLVQNVDVVVRGNAVYALPLIFLGPVHDCLLLEREGEGEGEGEREGGRAREREKESEREGEGEGEGGRAREREKESEREGEGE